MPRRHALAVIVAGLIGCGSSKDNQPPAADPWGGGPASTPAADPWGATPSASAPGAPEPPAQPSPAASVDSPIVGEWFQGSMGVDVFDPSSNTWQTATGSAETWRFDAGGSYEHAIFRLSRLGSCTRRFLTTRRGRFTAAGDTITLADQHSRIRAVSECSDGYEQAAPPDPSPLRFGIDGPLLTLVGPDGAVVANHFARRR